MKRWRNIFSSKFFSFDKATTATTKSSSRRKKRRLLTEALQNRQLLAGNVFDDALADGWQNWSWDSDVSFDSAAEVRDGNAAIAVTNNVAWGALYLANPDGLQVESDGELTFAVHGGNEGPELRLYIPTPDGRWIDGGSIETMPGQWQDVSVSLNSLGQSITAIDGFVLQDMTGTPNATYYVDTVDYTEAGSSSGPDGSGGQGSGELVSALYRDTYENDWQNWSWETVVDVANTDVVRSGSSAIAASYQSAYAGLYFGRLESEATTSFDTVEFSLNGGAGGQNINVSVLDGDGTYLTAYNLTLRPNEWNDYAINLWEFGDPSRVSGFVIQDSGAGNAETFYIDEVVFSEVGEPEAPLRDGPTITIDTANVIRTISDDVYGLSYADPELAADISVPVNRWGGNSTTRYNYQIDTFNTASDYFFENIAYENDNLEALPAGSQSDKFVEANNEVGSDTIITVNTLGWNAKSRDKVGGFSVAKYGEQQETDFWLPDAGNGIRPDGSYVTGNDPTDTSFQTDEEFTKDWIRHLQSQFGTAADGGVKYYALDNEPMLWWNTHRDVHPEPAGYDEVLEKGVTYAAAIKEVDPDAQVLGPVSWGWTGYFYSALDIDTGPEFWLNPQDRNAHGGKAFLPWYLEQMANAEQETGQRLLDYLDIHYYPQDDGVSLTNDGGTVGTQDARARTTRSLWDPEYVDPTWINDTVKLVPRMREWIDENYPGTKLAITEYNFGAIDHYSGALAQAEALGIFGREGVDLATMWATPDADDAAGFAFRMFRNYDGQLNAGSSFGETSVGATSSDLEDVSVFASTRASDGALTVMLINKSSEDLGTPLSIPNQYHGSVAEVYSYGRNDTSQINQHADLDISETTSIVLPRNSITLIEIAAANENTAPTAVDDEYSLEQGGTLSVVAAGVLTNDMDPDGQTLSVSIVEQPQNGVVQLEQDGSFTYTPNSGFYGEDRFTYVASDSIAISNEAIVTLTVEETKGLGGDESLFVLDNRRVIYQYGTEGEYEGETAFDRSNYRPRGLAISDDGSTSWVVNQSGEVSVYDRDGVELGSWQAEGLRYPEGIAVVGNDVLIVDRGSDSVHTFENAASLRAGSQEFGSSFKLARGNRTPFDMATDGTHLWVVNNTRNVDRVFVYDLDGTGIGSWVIDVENSRPTGITLDPNDPSHIYITDVKADQVFVYEDAALRIGGEQNAASRFELSGQNFAAHAIAMAPSEATWSNFSMPLDVSGDSVTSPIDALLLINHLNGEGEFSRDPLPKREFDMPYLDVNNDGAISPIDALSVINHLNQFGQDSHDSAVDMAFFDFGAGQFDDEEENEYLEEFVPFS